MNETTTFSIASGSTDAPSFSPSIPQDEEPSDGWLKTFALISCFSASLSILGSSMILRRIFISHRGNTSANTSTNFVMSTTPYNRLMMALSASDIYLSTVFVLSSFMDPQETSSFSWVVGNETTCVVFAFLIQIGIAPLLYNAMLSYYFLLTIRWAMSENTFSMAVEPILHTIAIGYPTSTAIYGLAMGYYKDNPNTLTCWVTDPNLAWIFAGIPLLLGFVSILINNLVIYCFVRRTIRQSLARSFRGQQQQDRIQAVATQAFLYVCTYVISYIWAYVNAITSYYTQEDWSSPLRISTRILYHFFQPLQGFWNALVFCRPRYLKFRQQQQQSQLSSESQLQNISSRIITATSTTITTTEDSSVSGRLRAIQWAIFGPEALPAMQQHSRRQSIMATVDQQTPTIGSSGKSFELTSPPIPSSGASSQLTSPAPLRVGPANNNNSGTCSGLPDSIEDSDGDNDWPAATDDVNDNDVLSPKATADGSAGENI